jgi:hypothetical protein
MLSLTNTLVFASRPKTVTVSGKILYQLNQSESEGYVWKDLEKGGVMKLKYTNGSEVLIIN